MSGGSFDYLCSRHSLGELLESTDHIDTMGQTLRNAGHEQAAVATESILADIKAFEESLLAQVEALRGVWKAVEWETSGDWAPDAVTEEAAAFLRRAGSAMPRAYDLVGDVTSPAEVFPRLEALERLAMTLAFTGHSNAAAETAEFLEEARTFATLTEQRLARLRGVWKAVEISDRPNITVAKRAERVASAVEEYRGLGAPSQRQPDGC